jgi:hypothetical protein
VTASSDAERLEDARRKLEEFEASGSGAELLARLRAASPLHPFLVARSLGGMLAVACGLATLASLVAPLASRDLAERMIALQSASGIPVPAALAILTVCAVAVMVAAHVAAVAAARGAPYRPHEAKIHQRLASELRQLEAQKAVKERMTPAGSGPRVLAR